METWAEARMVETQSLKTGEKPKESKTAKREGQLKVSKAYSIIILSSTMPLKHFMSIRLTQIEAAQIQSEICLPRIKPNWVWETKLLAIIASLSAKILETILKYKIPKIVSLNLSMITTFLDFHNKTIKLQLYPVEETLFERKILQP